MAYTSKYAAAHANPNGPGDARPTAMAIIEDEQLVNKLTDKVILITGEAANSIRVPALLSRRSTSNPFLKIPTDDGTITSCT
jgi:hypothetical protein